VPPNGGTEADRKIEFKVVKTNGLFLLCLSLHVDIKRDTEKIRRTLLFINKCSFVLAI
jgi:hypothetical protein